MAKIYFAGPLFNDAEKAFNAALTQQLEQLGFAVFLPQRDGVESNQAPYCTMTPEKRRQVLFELDRDQVLSCDIFLFILDGRVPDEGAALELGIAYTDRLLRNKNRRLLGLQTDIRAAFLKSRLNPMLKVPLDNIFMSQKDLLCYLKDL